MKLDRRAFLGFGFAVATGGGKVFASDGADSLYFNHATIGVSPATYREIAASAFLRNEFASFEERTTVRDGGKTRYTGIYLYGARTYLEFSQKDKPEDIGGVALGLWADRQSQLDPLVARLANLPGTTLSPGQTTILLGGVEIPWFKYIDIDTDPSMSEVKVLPWVMSVFPGYLKAKYPDLRPDEDGETREKQLARRFDPGRLLDDIDQIALATNRREADFLAAELSAFGLHDRLSAEGRSFDAQDVTINTNEAVDRTVTWSFRLNRAMPIQSIVFGNSTLTLDGRRANWVFRG